MAKGKYKGVPADLAAEEMLARLLEEIRKGTPQRRYAEEMERFLHDKTAQDRYAQKVAAWIATMRSPTVKSEIRSAMKKAKDIYEQLVERREAILAKAEAVKARVYT